MRSGFWLGRNLGMRAWCCVLTAVVVLSGCAPKEEEYAWTELPQAPRGWLGVVDPAFDAGGPGSDRSVRLMAGPTEGMFPASLAIARVVSVGEQKTQHGLVELADQPTREFVAWMELFTDYWQISDVLPLKYPGFRKHRGRAADFVQRASDIGADLCMIYTIDLQNPYCDIRGALYSTLDGRLLATVGADASVELPLDEEEYPVPPQGRVETDWRHLDPYFLALDKFRENFRQTVRLLIQQDEPTNAPTAWAPPAEDEEVPTVLTADH